MYFICLFIFAFPLPFSLIVKVTLNLSSVQALGQVRVRLISTNVYWLKLSVLLQSIKFFRELHNFELKGYLFIYFC